jgi:glycosyltransferase involved in cell wall biosynthesis
MCSNFFPPHVLGGAELVAYQHVKVLQEWGHEVRIFCGRLHDAPSHSYQITVEKDEFYKTRVSLSPRDVSGETWDFDNEPIRQAFTKAVKRFSPDVVHFRNLVGLSVQLIDECRKRGIPTVMTLHDHWGLCFKNTMLKNDGRPCLQGGFACLGCKETLMGEPPIPSPVRNSHVLIALRHVDRLIAPSEYLAARYAANGIPREQITVIKNGINLADFSIVRQEHAVCTLGFIGYLGTHKGLDVLLRSLVLLDDSAKVRLLVVGDGEERDQLVALCRKLHLEQTVTFCGRVDHHAMAAMYAKIDVLVVPSVWPENSPGVIAEAMASGIPVIASDIGGIGELVEDGVTGFLVPPRKSRALAERIVRLLNHPHLRREMGERALVSVQPYDLQRQVARMLDIFQELAERGRADHACDLDVLLYDADQHWSPYLRVIFQRLGDLETRLKKRLLVCRADLADEATWRLGKLLLIPSASRDLCSRAFEAFQRQIPLIVNACGEACKALCLASNAGLFYTDLDELEECVALLLTDEPLRRALGVNGQRFVETRFRHSQGDPSYLQPRPRGWRRVVPRALR